MKRETMKWGVIFALLLAVTCVHQVGAGELEPPGLPDDPNTMMPTLTDIYFKLLQIEWNQIQIKITQCIDSKKRFCDLYNGTVYDTTLGLIWLKNMNCLEGGVSWDAAREAASNLQDGKCGLSDGSQPGDWSLPSKKQWDYWCDAWPNVDTCLNLMNSAFDNVGESPAWWSNDGGADDNSKAYYIEDVCKVWGGTCTFLYPKNQYRMATFVRKP